MSVHVVFFLNYVLSFVLLRQKVFPLSYMFQRPLLSSSECCHTAVTCLISKTCNKPYIWETGRAFITSKKEHQKECETNCNSTYMRRKGKGKTGEFKISHFRSLQMGKPHNGLDLFILSHTWDSLLHDVAGVTDHMINPLSRLCPKTPADKGRHTMHPIETTLWKRQQWMPKHVR